MKVYRIDTEQGEYDTLTSQEVNELIVLNMRYWEDDEIREINYTVAQLQRARELHANNKWYSAFEDEYDFAPDVYDVLEFMEEK